MQTSSGASSTELFAHDALTVTQFNARLANAVAVAPGVHNVWIVGETSDVRLSRGHCYLELIERDEAGANRSRIRANIWASVYSALARKFLQGTGIPFASGMKVRARVSASYHPAYGMSATITDIDPAYTVGDAVRRRNEIINRLTEQKIIDLNRSLPFPLVPNRIAVISARGAAGYGDFINQLLGNPARLRFSLKLFPAVMQGDNTVPAILDALNAIQRQSEDFDAVVIIRGGGATSDLAAFDNYDLAAAVARFPIPVIVGIGHERDTTVLDYVANRPVKTPTAAAELLISRVTAVLDALSRVTNLIYQASTGRIAAHREFLTRQAASLPGFLRHTLLRHRSALERDAITLNNAVTRNLERNNEYLARAQDLLRVLSPDAVLARGFSITMLPDGTVVRNPDQTPPGTNLTTRLATGTIHSTT